MDPVFSLDAFPLDGVTHFLFILWEYDFFEEDLESPLIFVLFFF